MTFENFETLRDELYSALKIDDLRYVEIESKKKVLPGQVKRLLKFLENMKKARHIKRTYFFDQFLDTPKMDLLRLGASLRLRFKKGGERVYLQYKGPGFITDTILFRSEFSTKNLKGMSMEESHHDIIRFNKISIRKIIKTYADKGMAQAMQRHLGKKTLSRITNSPIISLYQKDKFSVKLGKAFLEPSVDRISAFHINHYGHHPLSKFYEYENEIKSEGSTLSTKLHHLPALLKFDKKIVEKFRLKTENLDKYHRCASIFSSRA